MDNTEIEHKQRQIKEWNENICRVIGNADKFPLEILDHSVQKNVIMRFFDFYLGGKVPSNLKATDLVFAVIAVMPLHLNTAATAWNDVEYESGASLFKLPPEDIELAERNIRATFNSIFFDDIEDTSLKENVDDKLTQDCNMISDINEIVDEHKENSFGNQKISDLGIIKCNKRNNDNQDASKSTINELNLECITLVERGGSGGINSDMAEEINNVNTQEKFCVNGTAGCKKHENCEAAQKTKQASFDQPSTSKNGEYKQSDEKVNKSSSVSFWFIKDSYRSRIDLAQPSGSTYQEYDVKENEDTNQNNSTLNHSRIIQSSTEVSNVETNSANVPLELYKPFRIPPNSRMIWYNYKKRPEIEINRPVYGPVENAAFIPFCKKLLDSWDDNKQARIVLKYLFGVIALTLMRGVTKTYRHITDALFSKKFLTHVNYICKFTNYNFQFFVPHKECIRTCHRTFKRREAKTIIMFSKIITCSNNIDEELTDLEYASNNLSNVFKAVLLGPTANYGLELVTMLQSVHDITGNINLVINLTHCSDTAESWKRLKKYLEKYVIQRCGRTHYWARVIDEKYFQDLSCSNNYPLVVILAVFNEKILRNDGIWRSRWVGESEDLVKYKERGEAMHAEFLRLQDKKTHRVFNFMVDFLGVPNINMPQHIEEQ